MRSLLSLLMIAMVSPLIAAGYQGQPQNSQWRDVVLNMQYEVANQSHELSALRERLDNQEHIIDSVRSESDRIQSMARELLRTQSEAVANKVSLVEGTQSRVKQDIEQLQSYATSINEHLAQYHNRLHDLEATVEQQGKSLQALEAAVRSLVDVLQPAEKSVAAQPELSDSIYKVVDGDSLGTIAKKHRTTIRKLKEINNLTGDRIIIGQKLKIPPADAQQ